QRDDHVAFAYAGALCWTLLFNRYNDHARFFRQIIKAHHAAVHRDGLGRDTDVAAADASVAQQAAGYEFRSVDADGKTYSLRGEDRRSVHANNSSCGIDQ